MFLWNCLAFSMIQWMLAIWSLVPLPFLKQLEHLEVHGSLLLKPGLDNFEHYFTSVWDDRGWNGWMASPTQSLGVGDGQGGLVCLVHGVTKSQTLLSNWTELNWDECNCVVVWAFFGIAFLWDWNENWSFPVLWPLIRFPNLWAYWVQHIYSIIF